MFTKVFKRVVAAALILTAGVAPFTAHADPPPAMGWCQVSHGSSAKLLKVELRNSLNRYRASGLGLDHLSWIELRSPDGNATSVNWETEANYTTIEHRVTYDPTKLVWEEPRLYGTGSPIGGEVLVAAVQVIERLEACLIPV